MKFSRGFTFFRIARTTHYHPLWKTNISFVLKEFLLWVTARRNKLGHLPCLGKGPEGLRNIDKSVKLTLIFFHGVTHQVSDLGWFNLDFGSYLGWWSSSAGTRYLLSKLDGAAFQVNQIQV